MRPWAMMRPSTGLLREPGRTGSWGRNWGFNRRVKKGEEWSDVASFFDVTLWAKSAENLQKYIVKGQQVALTAELEQQRWEKDGQKFSKIALANVQVQLVGGGKREGSAPAPSGRGEQHPNETYEDNIPF